MARSPKPVAPEVEGLTAGRPFVGTWLRRPGRTFTYYRPSDCRPSALRINVHVWDEGAGSSVKVIEGDGRKPEFREHDLVLLPESPSDEMIRQVVRILSRQHLDIGPAAGDDAARTLAGVLTSAGFLKDDFFGGEAWLKPAGREGFVLFVRGEPDPVFFERDGEQQAVPRAMSLESPDLPCEAGILYEDDLGMSTVVAGNLDDALRVLEDELLPYPSGGGEHEIHAIDALMPTRAP